MKPEEGKEGIMEWQAVGTLELCIPKVHPVRELAVATAQENLMIDVGVMPFETSTSLHSIHVRSLSLQAMFNSTSRYSTRNTYCNLAEVDHRSDDHIFGPHMGILVPRFRMANYIVLGDVVSHSRRRSEEASKFRRSLELRTSGSIQFRPVCILSALSCTQSTRYVRSRLRRSRLCSSDSPSTRPTYVFNPSSTAIRQA